MIDTASPLTRANPAGPAEGVTRVMRGGSYLCHDSYCSRYLRGLLQRLNAERVQLEGHASRRVPPTHGRAPTAPGWSLALTRRLVSCADAVRPQKDADLVDVRRAVDARSGSRDEALAVVRLRRLEAGLIAE
jgi:hypothetical protein